MVEYVPIMVFAISVVYAFKALFIRRECTKSDLKTKRQHSSKDVERDRYERKLDDLIDTFDKMKL